MKKMIVFITIMALGLLLAACGGTDSTTTASDATGNQASTTTVAPEGTAVPQSFDPANFQMPLQTTLLVGTFKLEETDLAVNTGQAAELLPLWQVLRSLYGSETAASEEITALIDQINETMTPEQLQQIEAMKLTMQDYTVLMQEAGVDVTAGRTNASGTQVASGMGPGGGGELVPGMGPGGGQGGGQGAGGGEGGQFTGMTQEQIATLQAERQAAGGGAGGLGRMNVEVIDLLIELLQSKIN